MKCVHLQRNTYFTSHSFQCTECLNSLCSGCQLKDGQRILFNGKCNHCSSKMTRKLQEICRDVIRRTIACNLEYFGWEGKQKSTPTIRINSVIKEQKLPKPIIDLLLIES